MRRLLCVLGLLGATGLATMVGCGASPEVDEPEAASGEVELPDSLDECNRACRNGQQAMEQFCAQLPPDPRLKAGCWAAAKGSLVACLGWCYWHYGT
jgi:hypothetical protein